MGMGCLHDDCRVDKPDIKEERKKKNHCLPKADNIPKIFLDDFNDTLIIPGGDTLCMTRNGDIFLLNETGTCRKYEKNGIFSFALNDQLICNPIDVATLPNRRILLSVSDEGDKKHRSKRAFPNIADEGHNIGDGKILLFNAKGNLLNIFASGLTSPVGITTDLDNFIYVCDKIDNCVIQFDEYGYVVRVFKPFNTPTCVRTDSEGHIFVSDADGIYCLNSCGKLIWKRAIITGCTFCVLPCGCVVLDHVPSANIPVVSIIGKSHSTPNTVTKSTIGSSGIYIDSEETVWVANASNRHFMQLQMNHNHKGITKEFVSKELVLNGSFQRLVRANSSPLIDDPIPSSSRTSHLLTRSLSMDLICDERAQISYRKRMSLYKVMTENRISAVCERNCQVYTFDRPVTLETFIKYKIQGTHIQPKVIEDSLLQDIDPNSTSSLDNALISIVDCRSENEYKNLLMTKNLLENGADVNSEDFSGNTALHKAVLRNKDMHVRLLLSYGADPSAVNDRGDTPLSLSVLYSPSQFLLGDKTKAMTWSLCKYFLHTHIAEKLIVWPGFKPDKVKYFQDGRKVQRVINSVFNEHLKNQKDICSQMLKHANWMEKRKTTRGEDHGVYIVSETEKKIVSETEVFRGIRIIWRRFHEVSPEASYLGSKGLLQIQRNPDNLLAKVKEEIKSESQHLFRQHSNLNIISPSAVKSINFSSGENTFLPVISVGLYCNVKGVVPVGEQLFPTHIGNIPTDVREGHFTFGNGPKGPNDYHEKLKIGCCISADNSSRSGTLGGFVEVDNDVFFLTAAHLLFDIRAIDMGLPSYLKFSSVYVLQPTKSSSSNNADCKPVGQVVNANFKHGCHCKVSLDAALIRLTDHGRAPVDGSVPGEKLEKLLAAGYDLSNLPVFNSGEVLETIDEDLRRNDVVKFGAESGLTRGVLNIDGSHVRIEHKELNTNMKRYLNVQEDVKFTMYNQREILNLGDRIFFELGDSGALVFMQVGQGKTKCIGLAIGKTSYGSCIMTPISNILKEFNLPLKLMSFSRQIRCSNTSPNQDCKKRGQLKSKSLKKPSFKKNLSRGFKKKKFQTGFKPSCSSTNISDSSPEMLDLLKSIHSQVQNNAQQNEEINKKIEKLEVRVSKAENANIPIASDWIDDFIPDGDDIKTPQSSVEQRNLTEFLSKRKSNSDIMLCSPLKQQKSFDCDDFQTPQSIQMSHSLQTPQSMQMPNSTESSYEMNVTLHTPQVQDCDKF